MQKKKKKAISTKSEDEYGEFVCAESSATKREMSGNTSVTLSEANGAECNEVQQKPHCSHVSEVQASNAQHNDSEMANHELSELAKSMIDGLFGKDANTAKNSEISDIATKFDQVFPFLLSVLPSEFNDL